MVYNLTYFAWYYSPVVVTTFQNFAWRSWKRETISWIIKVSIILPPPPIYIYIYSNCQFFYYRTSLHQSRIKHPWECTSHRAKFTFENLAAFRYLYDFFDQLQTHIFCYRIDTNYMSVAVERSVKGMLKRKVGKKYRLREYLWLERY